MSDALDICQRTPFRVGLGAVLGVLACELLVAAVVIPPWQNPDDPVHFAATRELARRGAFELDVHGYHDVQSEVLESMAAHGWWAAYEQAVPSPLPRRFDDLPETLGDPSSAPTLYYAASALLLRLAGIESIEGQFFALRALSAFISLCAVAVLSAGTRAWFGERAAVAAAAFAALLPQFAVISISVSPDPFVNLCGAVVWYLSPRLWFRSEWRGTVVALALVVLVAVASKNLAKVMPAQLVCLGGLAFWHRSAMRRVRAAVVLALGVAATLGLAAWLLLVRPEILLPFVRLDGLPLDAVRRFWAQLAQSFFLNAGWLRFPAPPFAVAVFVTTTLGALALSAGVARGERQVAGVRAAGVFIAVQVAAVLAAFTLGEGTQGRFLFPVLGPLAGTWGLGVSWLAGRSRALGAALLVVLAVLNLTGWAVVLIPAYAM